MAPLLGATLLLGACDGDSRPFSEAAEVRALNLVSVEVTPPANALDAIFLNINQGLQLGVLGNPGDGDPSPLSSNNREWSVSDPRVASITKNGYLRALADGSVSVTVSIGGLLSSGFALTVRDATLTGINPISGVTTLERCLPQTYSATGLFSDNTDRFLDNISWTVSDASNARLFESNGRSTKLNALAASDQLTLTATVPGGQSRNKDLTVSDSLQAITIRPLPIALAVGDERRVSAYGTYAVTSGDTANATRDVDITNSIDWAVVTGTANLSVTNERGNKGLLKGLNEDADANITASCGLEVHRVPVDINASDEASSLAIRIGDQDVTGSQITLSLATNPGAIPIRASTGSEYDADDDVTGTVDFQRQESLSSLTAPFEIGGNDTSTPTIRLTGLGTAIIVATESTDGELVKTITVTVTN